MLAGFNWAGDTEREKTIRVWPDRRLFIKAVVQVPGTVKVTAPLIEQTTNFCTAVVSFVPERLRHYEIRQTLSTTACTATVTDLATMRPPPSLEIHPVKESCRIRR